MSSKKLKFKKAKLPLSKAEKEYIEDSFINKDEPKKAKQKKHSYLMQFSQEDWINLKKISYVTDTTVQALCMKAIQKMIDAELKKLENSL
jgi:hypothetical protein